MRPLPRSITSLLASSGIHIGLFVLALLTLHPLLTRGERVFEPLHEVAMAPALQVEALPEPAEEDAVLDSQPPEQDPLVREVEVPVELPPDKEFAPVDLDPSPLDGVLVVLPAPPDPPVEDSDEAPKEAVPVDASPLVEPVEEKVLGADTPDQPPVPLSEYCRSPLYPTRAIRSKWTGTVVAQLSVGEAGEVLAVALIKSSGYKILDQAALACLEDWRFRPGTRQGEVASMDVIKRIEFRL